MRSVRWGIACFEALFRARKISGEMSSTKAQSSVSGFSLVRQVFPAIGSADSPRRDRHDHHAEVWARRVVVEPALEALLIHFEFMTNAVDVIGHPSRGLCWRAHQHSACIG